MVYRWVLNCSCGQSLLWLILCAVNDLCGRLRSVRNNNVDKPVARHFNSIDHSISDMKVCTISTISGEIMLNAKGRKSISFLKLETFIPTSSTNDFLLSDSSIA